MLRLPKHRLSDADQLTDKVLDVDGYELILSKPQQKALSPLTTIFSRYIITENIEDEEAFLNQAAELLKKRRDSG